MRRPIAHLGTTQTVHSSAGTTFFAALSRHSDLITAAAAFAVIYFLLIRKQ